MVPSQTGANVRWIVTTLDGHILQASVSISEFLNTSRLVDRDFFHFIERDREVLRRSILNITPNVTVERVLSVRPRGRRPVSVAALVKRRQGGDMLLWELTDVGGQRENTDV